MAIVIKKGIYSDLNASIGSMLDAFQAGYRPDRIQTIRPIAIPMGIYMILSGRKKYFVVPIM